MLFTVNNTKQVSIEQLRTTTLLNAYSIINNYPLKASELALDNYLQSAYNTTLKNMCIKLLLNITYYKDDTGNLVLLFKDYSYDKIASLITYGNGAIPGSKILRIALNN